LQVNVLAPPAQIDELPRASASSSPPAALRRHALLTVADPLAA